PLGADSATLRRPVGNVGETARRAPHAEAVHTHDDSVATTTTPTAATASGVIRQRVGARSRVLSRSRCSQTGRLLWRRWGRADLAGEPNVVAFEFACPRSVGTRSSGKR